MIDGERLYYECAGALKHLTGLTRLDMSGAQIDDSLLGTISHLRHMRWLSLTDGRMSDTSETCHP